MNHRYKIIILVLFIALPASIILACGLGAVNVSPANCLAVIGNQLGLTELPAGLEQVETVIWNIRIPRVLMSVLVGASLALCGTGMQGLFRNSLADPSLIGISGGAAFAAASVIILTDGALFAMGIFAGISALPLAAFTGAILATLLIYFLAREKHRINMSTMLLAGIAVNAMTGAGTGILVFMADDAQLRTLTFWTLGSLAGASWYTVAALSVTTSICLFFLTRSAKSFNALALGEQEAAHIGISLVSFKRKVIICTSLAVGACVAFSGIISFIGLIAPHLLRMAGVTDHRYLLIASALGGAVLLCWGDVISRTIVSPAELPIGLITGLAGAPLFLFLLSRQKRSLH